MISSIQISKLSRDDFISRLYSVCHAHIISEEALKAFDMLFLILQAQKAMPHTFALLAHEIGHLDASFCNDAVVRSITVSGRTLKYISYEDGGYSWYYTFNPLKILSSYTYAYSPVTNDVELKHILTNMYSKGLVYTNLVKKLDCNGEWELSNYLYDLFLMSHFNRNSFGSNQSKNGDVQVLDRLSQTTNGAHDTNTRLKKLCKF